MNRAGRLLRWAAHILFNKSPGRMLPFAAGRSRPHRVAAAVAVALAAAILIGAGVIALELRNEALETTAQDNRRLATVLAAYTGRLFQAVDLTLNDIARDLNLADMSKPEQFRVAIATQQSHRDFVARASGLPQLDWLAAVDADGILINSSRGWPTPPFDVTHRAYFSEMRKDGGSELFISEPTLSRLTGNWTVFLFRRISAPDGSFLGLLGGGVQLSYFNAFHAALDLPPGMRITLVRRDGMILATFPNDTDLRASVMPPASNWYRTVAAGGGTYWSQGLLDGSMRLVSVRPVDGFPIVVNVGVTRTALFAPWWDKVARIGVATLCAIGGIVVLLRLLVAQFRRLEETRVLLETTLANVDQGLIMVTADRTVAVCNERAMALLDLPPALMNRRPTFEDVVAYQNKIGEFGCDEVTSLPVIETSDFTSRPPTFERQRPNGVWLEIRTMMLPDGGMVRTYTDITGRKVTEKRIGDAALHDALTGLPNRTLFGRRLDEAVARSASGGPPVAAMFLDLDRFKRVNDTLGHAAGDELLQQVSSRMKAVVRDSDTLARMGGDEFALLMPGIGGPEAAIATAERLLCAVGQPYSLRGGNAHIGVSIGIVRHPAHGGTAAELTRNADLALYRAKASGRNVFCEFEPRLDIQNAGALALEAELEMALQNGEFALDYQPIWDVAAERVTCVEALLRWHHPIRGIIPPVNFIPLAERSGLIIPIGRWVMEAACREALTWEVPVEVAVNVAPAQVRRREIVEDVAAVLEATGLPPERLKLEITESQELEETDSVIATLAALRGLGLRLALDDFGTAHASLSTLRAFPFTDVKIDRSFTQGLLQDSRAQGLLEAILQVCRVLSLDCVAEGVETQAQFDLVSTLGCTHVQGYLIGRPQGADAIRRRLGRPSSLMPDLPARRREPADQT